ncbi:MAG: copper resistance CopC family protein [Wenzhouxiangella sp.]
MKINIVFHLGLAALLLTVTLSLAAHEAKLSSTPENGATIHGSPELIGIQFEGSMRITHFEVTGPEGTVPLADEPGSDPSEQYFVEPAEALEAGLYQVRWRGLARDGHMMTGGFSFTVKE